MPRLAEVRRGVFVERVVAAAHVAADQAFAKVHPFASHAQTLFTAARWPSHADYRDLTNV